MSTVFISGSISIKKLPRPVEESLRKISDANMEVLVGDANGIDLMIQSYYKHLDYNKVTVYSIYASPRNIVADFKKKHIIPKCDSNKERDLQKEKDSAMTLDSSYSFIIWDGRSNGSYNNILRAIEHRKKIKLYLNNENRYLESEKINIKEIQYIYRKNNGYSAAEIVEYLKNEGEGFFSQTKILNKYLLENKVIKKENGTYLPMPEYQNLFIIDKYKGKATGIKFTNNFINWIENRLKKIKPHIEQSLF
jgi:hypothetical protein